MKNKAKKEIASYHVKVDQGMLAAAQSLVDLPAAFRQLVEKITKTKKCPCCGTVLKAK